METGTDSAYGTWTDPSATKTVRYSLAAFHEIGFLVNEGYRRIPYGGIEHGGFLFGSVSDREIRIDAFRQIEAEHASGPAFVLSESDIARAKEQIPSASADAELAGRVPVGLFISHARRDFEMADDERRLLELLLPEQGRILVLVKPEKFKQTRFAFVLPGDSAIHIFTLPPLRPAAEMPTEKPKKQRRRATVVELPQAESPVSEPATVAPPAPPEVILATARKRNWLWLAAAGVLSAALILGCFLYFDWNYLEAPIELHAAVSGNGMTVSWGPKETIRTNEPKLQIWSGTASRIIHLSYEEKTKGRAYITPPGPDFTVELVARHWLHDRRGTIRVVNK